MGVNDIVKNIPENWAEIHKKRINELAVEITEKILLNEYKIHLGSNTKDLAKINEVLENPGRKLIGIQMMCHQVSVGIGVPSEDLEAAVSSTSHMMAAYDIFNEEYLELMGEIPADDKGNKIYPEPIEAIISKGVNNSDLLAIQGLNDLLASGLSLL